MKSLTSHAEIDNIIHLLKLSEPERNQKMQGVIRPISRQRKCPKCKKRFKHYLKVGYICPECKTTPDRFFIDLHWNGQRPGIYSDKLGQPLDSYQRALNLFAKIQGEVDTHTFDPTRYVKKDLHAFLFENLMKDWYLIRKRQLIRINFLGPMLALLKGILTITCYRFSKAKIYEISVRSI